MTMKNNCDARDTLDEKKICKYNLTLLTLFFMLISIPGIGTLFGWDFYPAQDENRLLADSTILENAPVDEVPNRFERYFKDNFGFRNTLIRRYRKLQGTVSGNRADKVMIGKEKWLYLVAEGGITDYCGGGRLSDEELKIWTEALAARKRYLEKQGVKYLFVIVPNKVQVYPEFLPERIQKSAGQPRSNQLLKHLKDNSDVNVINLKEALVNAKKHHQVYLSSDTHWSEYGSLVGQSAIIANLRTYFPELKGLPESACAVEQEPWPGDLSKMLGLQEKYTTIGERLTPQTDAVISTKPYLFANQADVTLPKALKRNQPQTMINPLGKRRALIFHDSFGTFGFYKTFPEVFKETTFFYAYSDENILRDSVEQLKPDVVIEVMVERRLGQLKRAKLQEWFKSFSGEK